MSGFQRWAGHVASTLKLSVSRFPDLDVPWEEGRKVNGNMSKIFWLKNREGDLEYRPAESFVQCSRASSVCHALGVSVPREHPVLYTHASTALPLRLAQPRSWLESRLLTLPRFRSLCGSHNPLGKEYPRLIPPGGLCIRTWEDRMWRWVERKGRGIWCSCSSGLWHAVFIGGTQVPPVYIKAQKVTRAYRDVCVDCAKLSGSVLGWAFLSFSFLQHKH